MGDFSIHCSLSGLPITANQPVVCWKLQESKFKDSYSPKYIPASLPIHGFYDYAGGVQDENGNDISLDGMVAICHLDFWKALPKFWNKDDGTQSIKESILNAHKEFVESYNLYVKMHESDPASNIWKNRVDDKLRTAHMAMPHERCFLMWMDKIWIGEPSQDDGVKHEERKDFTYDKCSGVFEQTVLNLIINPKVEGFDNICSDLEKLLIAYMTTYIRGHMIVPTCFTHAVQYPDYKMESKWFDMINKKAQTLAKRKNQYISKKVSKTAK